MSIIHDKKGRIIVVDDDSADFNLIQTSFSDLNILNPLIHIKNGVELDKLLIELNKNSEEEKISFILLDLNLPYKNGKEILVEIKANQQVKEIPIIIYTTSNLHEDKEKCIELGANLFIKKPDKYSELINLFNSLKSSYID